VREHLGIHAFGVNAYTPGEDGTLINEHDEADTDDQQEELYFVHRGRMEFAFGDGTSVVLGPGGFLRVDPPTERKLRNVGDEDAVYVIAGGKDGYVGRDGQLPPGEQRSMP